MYHSQGEVDEDRFVCVPFLILCQDMAGSQWDFILHILSPLAFSM